MYRWKVSRWLALVSVLAALGCARDRRTVEDGVAAIEAVSAARARAFNQSDADGIAIHFTEEAVLMPPGKGVLIGREAVRAYYQAIFDAYEPELESGYDEVRVSGDLAYGRGTARARMTPKDGGPAVESTSTYINILERLPDGSWKTTHDIWNANEPIVAGQTQ